MEERVELETVRVVLGGFANTSLVPENKRPASNQARSIPSFPAALLSVPEGSPVSATQRVAAKRTAAAAFAWIDRVSWHHCCFNWDVSNYRKSSRHQYQLHSMGLCKFLALAPHVIHDHVINSFQRIRINGQRIFLDVHH